MDFRNRRHERGSNWTDPEIVELLQLWSDEAVQVELESSLRNQRVFDRIANVLLEKGIYRSGDQCREKIKKMKLEYRRIKDNLKMRSWRFYDVMDRVLANRPSVTYSSLGGSVVAQQVFQIPPGAESYLHAAQEASSFAPVTSGGFLFGQPTGSGDLLDVKCEDVEDGGGLDSGGAPSVPAYEISGDEPETEHSGLDPERGQEAEGGLELGHGDVSATTAVSPSGFSDLRMAGSPPSAKPSAGGSVAEGSGPARPAPGRQRKRRRAGKGSSSSSFCGRGGAAVAADPAMAASTGLDRALASFLNWQRAAEERLLSLEEARLDREEQAEERRERQEERRGELERQHELRLLGVFAGALAAVKDGGVTPASTPTAPPQPGPPAPAQTAPTAAHKESTAVTSALAQSPSLTTSATPPTSSSSVASASSSSSSVSKASSETPPAGSRPPTESPLSGAALPGPGAPEGPQAGPPGLEAPGPSPYLSKRGNSVRGHQGILQEGFARYNADRHHQQHNPDGFINLGTSENKLCFDLLHSRLTQPDMLHIDPSLLQYPDWKGHGFLRRAVADFLSHYCGSRSPLDPDNVIVMNGCGSLFSAIAAVICDPEEAILIPTPFYGVITEDVGLYSGVKLFHVPLDCEASGDGTRPFHLTVEKLEDGLQRAKEQGVMVRGVILVNPHNPLADIYTPQEMAGFLEFAKRYELHAIVDEVYMLTIFQEKVSFQSVLGMDSLPDPQRTHVLWGFSKDFAMAGIRVGTLYTENTDLMEALSQLANLHGVPGSTQHQMAQLLQDRDWISEVFLPENQRRLKTSHGYVAAELSRLGVPYLHRPACFYLWADLRKYLGEASFSAELSLWRVFLRHKVVLSCGQAFSCSTPGWFRIVFADKQHPLELGMRRIGEALRKVKEQRGDSDLSLIKEAIDVTRRSTKTDGVCPDTTAIVCARTAPSPDKPSDRANDDNNGPAPAGTPLDAEEFVVVDCQSSKPTESLDSLMGVLRQQIRSSDWLEKNTPELCDGEDPGVLEVFTDLLRRVKK
ncbi:1-aminocyclopropane-1-carboxylate synthase-like protein 1 [Gadus macrocephalus]|uniref:1-aminocyclopropane-1-carboxylate synthase-like protein 1 n=1 Tax=Gadus macrocephalus TaxID=80720 RepID=UPI0028CB5EA3|nr:1-aminocyclopropane-1-carboxylate synthase-like protein 1 [Gadus macrocephalus]